jgi:hypothetical protein
LFFKYKIVCDCDALHKSDFCYLDILDIKIVFKVELQKVLFYFFV